MFINHLNRFYRFGNCEACPFLTGPCPGPCIGRPFSSGAAGGGKEVTQNELKQEYARQAQIAAGQAALGKIIAPPSDDREKALQDMRKEAAALDQEIARRKRDIDYKKQRSDLMAQIALKRNELARLNREAGL